MYNCMRNEHTHRESSACLATHIHGRPSRRHPPPASTGSAQGQRYTPQGGLACWCPYVGRASPLLDAVTAKLKAPLWGIWPKPNGRMVDHTAGAAFFGLSSDMVGSESLVLLPLRPGCYPLSTVPFHLPPAAHGAASPSNLPWRRPTPCSLLAPSHPLEPQADSELMGELGGLEEELDVLNDETFGDLGEFDAREATTCNLVAPCL